MRPIILTTILCLHCWFCGTACGQPNPNKPTTKPTNEIAGLKWKDSRLDATSQAMYDDWEQGAATNGLICAIQKSFITSDKKCVFYVNVINTTTNWVKGYLNLPIQGLANIELFDHQERIVEKLDAGKSFSIWTQEQIKDWLKLRPRNASFFILPLDTSKISGWLELLNIFKIKQAGTYVLHLRLCLAQTKIDKNGQPYFSRVWLPEVVAKVQIRPEDIPQENLPASSQTNSPAK